MTTTSGDYNLSSPDVLDPLSDPPHSTLHQQTNAAINDLSRRIGMVESAAPQVSADIEHARLAAHTVMVRGQLTASLTGTLLVPVIWNLTGREVSFQAAKATTEMQADADLVFDIVNGSTLNGNTYDEQLHTSVFKDGPLVIPAGEYFSPSVDVDGFAINQAEDTYLAVVLVQMGSDDAPGGSITVQINRLL